MPTYDLRCGACGKVWERFMPRLITDEDRVCPSCGSKEVKTGVGGGYLNTGRSVAGEHACGGASSGGG